MNIKVPDKIKYFIDGKPYATDCTGLSGSTVFTFHDMVLKIEEQRDSFSSMLQTMKWLEGRLPIPQVICHECADGRNYLLMTRVKGKMSCDEYYLNHPDELASLLAEGLKMLWRLDPSGCPCIRDLDAELAEAEYRVENHLVDIENAEPDTFSERGFQSPAELLQWLKENRPPIEPVFSHGDFCLPNVFIDKGVISGFIDLGDAGIGDKWRDIALCYRSLKHNLDGTFGGRVYDNFSPHLLFDKLGINPDLEKLRYYILLDELF